MDIALWVVQGLLALAFAGAGITKLVTERKRLVDKGMGWAAHYSDGAVKAIGAVELVGAVGLVLPAALGIAPILTPLAGLGLALLMGGAVVDHLRHQDAKGAPPALVLGLLALFVAVGRFLVG